MADGNATKLPSMLFEPIAGLGVGYQFINAAQTVAERRTRVATLAALLSASTATAVGSTAAANAGLGAVVAAHIAHMRDVLQIRGGQILSSKVNKTVLDSVRTSVFEIHPYRTQFTYNSRMIIDSMFQENTTRRSLQGSIYKIKTVAPTYLVPIASTQINTSALIDWACFGVTLIGFRTLGALYLFQCAERQRWQNKNDGVRIDVSASFSE